jgi:hypothetical protein
MDSLASPDDFTLRLAALRKAGVARFDAVTLHYLETLNQRLPGLDAEVQKIVRPKLSQALVDLTVRFEQAPPTARHQPAQKITVQEQPDSPLRALVRDLQAHTLSPPPLKALQKNLSALSVNKQVSQALRQAPQNAGPINSHMLMLRSLELLRELSPAYLQRFMAYADTLLVLEQAGMKKPSTSKPRKAKT